VSVAAARYDGTIHDFVLLNALRNVPSTEAAIEQINGRSPRVSRRERFEPIQTRRGENYPPRPYSRE
jgi:hypothetical protein